MGRTVVSDDEDEILGEEEEDREPRDGEDIEDRDDEEDDEDDEEGQDEFEKDGFIVDDVDDEEEEDDAGDVKQKKKKRRKRESEKEFVLDEDDYELLEDHGITRSKKFKRLKKAGRGNEPDGGPGFFDEDVDRADRSRRSIEGSMKHRPNDRERGSRYEDHGEEEGHPEENDDEDDMSKFIVDEEDEYDELNGEPTRRVSKPKPNWQHSDDAGITSDSLEEAVDLFGDVDKLLQMRLEIRRNANMDEQGPNGLETEFEPIILQEKFMTERDEEIREIDIPERMQILEESTGPSPTDDMLEQESTWIHEQLLSNMLHLFGKEELNDDDLNERTGWAENMKYDIHRILHLMHMEKFDIPFIAMYRKESFPILLQYYEEIKVENKDGKDTVVFSTAHDEDPPKLKWHKVLWAIRDLDRKWILLRKRKTALQSYYYKRYQEESQRIEDLRRLNMNDGLYESIKSSLEAAESEKEVDDVDAKFNLHFPPGEVGAQEGQFKRPMRKSKYIDCKNAGLWDVASKIGYNSEQFGLLINLEHMEEFVDDKDDPDTVAANFTCQDFGTSLDVLKGARFMAAVEISNEPRVRKHVRLHFMKDAVISTIPTRDGYTAIDPFHEFAPVKWIVKKPIRLFKNADWLLIQKAEEEKLLQVTIELPTIDSLIKQFSEYYLSDNVSNTARLWNEQRQLILNDAFYNFLLPLMKKEARAILTVRAKNWLLTEYGKQLWRKVSIAPYKKKETEVGSDDEAAAPRVLACCWKLERPSNTFVMVDSTGLFLDEIATGPLQTKSKLVMDQQRANNDFQRLLKFIADYQPEVVVLGAASLKCEQLKNDIFEVIFKLVEDRPREISHNIAEIEVVFADESLPRLYENTRVAQDQIPGQTSLVRRAVALARYLQNPLAMVATLCGAGRDITSWKLISSEAFLSNDEKYDMVEQVMVDCANQVGFDINAAISHDWLFAPLQFISGLGPRKAASLQKLLGRQQGAVTSRKDLAHYLKKKVFMNAVGFIRIRQSGSASSTSYLMDLLDDTRIHPESYEVAKRMAKDLHDVDKNAMNDEEEAQEMAIEYVRENPHHLNALNIKTYAASIDDEKIETLRDVRMELMDGFRDCRIPFIKFDAHEAFFLLCGETEDTLAEGRIVEATVRNIQASRVWVNLECGLSGCVSSDDYSDSMNVQLSEGDSLRCMIKDVQVDRQLVNLTCKESDLKRIPVRRFERDPYYKPNEGSLQTEQEKARKEKEKLLAKKRLQSRMIVHPRFQNITADEAKEFLADKEEGESIIRPSIRGPNFLTLTIKVHDGVYADREIIEGGKDHRNMSNLLKLGKTLKIGDDTFDDLDEVIDRYVDPLVANLRLMLNYRKFKKGSKAEIDEILRREKLENPSRIVYCFGICHEYPGTFCLTCIRSANVRHEYISWLPKGFKFRKRVFEDIDRLVNYFQRHVNDMPPENTPSIRSVAAMVPMRSPGGGGGGGWGVPSGNSGDGNDGGWGGQTNSGPPSRTGRDNFRNNSGHHPSGLPKPDGGRGRGRGRDSYSDRGNNNNTDGGSEGRNSFPGAKVQNSPGREAFPGGWGSGGSGGGGSGDVGWGSGGGGSTRDSDGQKDGGGDSYNVGAGGRGDRSGGRSDYGGRDGRSGSGRRGGYSGGGGRGGNRDSDNYGGGSNNGGSNVGSGGSSWGSGSWDISEKKDAAPSSTPGPADGNSGWGNSKKADGGDDGGSGWGGSGW